MDEQPATGSEASVMDRLAAFVGGQPEAAPTEEAEAQEAPQEETQAAPETEAQAEPEQAEAPADEFAEIEDDEGQRYKVPAKFKDSHLRWKDYTQKTQETAKLQAQAQDRIQYAEAREQITQAVISDVIAHQQLQAQLEQYKNLNWSQLYAADPGQAMQLRDQRDQLERQISAKEAEIRTKADQHKRIADQHGERQWALAVEATKAKLGQVSPADDAAMLKQVRDMGFSETELRTRFADPRFLQLVYKAARFDAMSSNAKQVVQKAPPVLKPGASKGQGAVAADQYKNDRQQLRKSGSVEDAGRLLARMVR